MNTIKPPSELDKLRKFIVIWASEEEDEPYQRLKAKSSALCCGVESYIPCLDFFVELKFLVEAGLLNSVATFKKTLDEQTEFEGEKTIGTFTLKQGSIKNRQISLKGIWEKGEIKYTGVFEAIAWPW